MPNQRSLLIRVTPTAREIVEDLEAACWKYAAIVKAKKPKEYEDAMAALNQRRKELYEYLHDVEVNAGIPSNRQTIKLRFD